MLTLETKSSPVNGKIFAKRLMIHVLSVLLLTITGLALWSGDLALAKMATTYIVQIMFGMLVFGIVSLFARQKQLIVVSFACTALVCLFLKGNSNDALMFSRPEAEADLSVANINLSEAEGDFGSLAEVLISGKADVVCFHEVTPDWDIALQETLSRDYPFSRTVVRIDFFGMAVYSKYPFHSLDTMMYGDIPCILAGVQKNERRPPVQLLLMHTEPLFNASSYAALRQHLMHIAGRIADYKDGLIALGNYNTVGWSSEMRDFRNALRLLNSRRYSTLNEIPIDHIFYSDNMDCNRFSALYSQTGKKIGIRGAYQYRAEE